MNEQEAVEALPERLRDVGEALQELVAIRMLAGLEPREKLLQCQRDPRIVRHVHGRCGFVQGSCKRITDLAVHAPPPNACFSRARARTQSFSTLSSVRIIA